MKIPLIIKKIRFLDMNKHSELKVALVVDWLTVYGGAERVVEQIVECFPNCEIFL